MPGDATDAYAAEKLDSALADSPGEPKHQQQVHAVHSDDELPLKYPNNVVAQSEYFDHDLPIPSQEDLATLRRISEKIPIKVYTIAFVELVERLSFYGTTQVRTMLIRPMLPAAHEVLATRFLSTSFSSQTPARPPARLSTQALLMLSPVHLVWASRHPPG